MTILLLMMLLENANNNGGFMANGPMFNRPAVTRSGDRPVVRFLARPFRRNR